MDGAARPYVLQQYKHARLSKGQSQTYQNLIFVSGTERPDEFEARRVNPQAMLVKGRTAAGDHLALIGVSGQIPLEDFETDAAIYDVVGNTLHLAGVTTLKARIGTEMREIFWSTEPVNVLVDCETGKGQIEVRGEPRCRSRPAKPGPRKSRAGRAVTLAQAGELPRPAATGRGAVGPQQGRRAARRAKTPASADVFEAKPAAAASAPA